MSVETNKQMAQKFFAMMNSGDFDGAFALMTADAFWWMPTDKPGGSKIYKDEMRKVVGAVGRIFARLPELRNGRITAEGDRVCIEQTGRGGMTHGGVPYENDYHMLVEFSGGLIREIREYMNPVLSAPIVPELTAAQQSG